MGPLLEVLDALLQHPSGPFVTDLALSSADRELAPAIARLVEMAELPPLRRLSLQSLATVPPIVPSLHDLWPRVPDLTYLELAGAFDVGDPVIPAVTHAQFLGCLDPAGARAIAVAPWPQLTTWC
ncbi:MAG: hypothetical protein WKG01_21625 [Kofleriaceae bacterium]